MKVKALAIGLGAFAAGTAALAAGAVALATRPRPKGEGGRSGPAPQPDSPQPSAALPDNGPTPPAQPAPAGAQGHAAPDLAADAAPGQRAPQAFRPDIDAPMTPEEREALRPATGPSPSLVSDEGGSVQGPGGDRY